ncbi:MAG: hypothetical protein II998_03175 [Clostridia bacterium]|nr:hypothetical protein [Clostridia bacterium]
MKRFTKQVMALIIGVIMAISMLTTVAFAESGAVSVSFDGSTNYYSTIDEAWSAAIALDTTEDNKATITLLEDCAAQACLTNTDDYLVLDTNGKTLSAKTEVVEVKGGQLNITGSGSVVGSPTYTITSGVVNIKGGKVYVDGATIQNKGQMFALPIFVEEGEFHLLSGHLISAANYAVRIVSEQGKAFLYSGIIEVCGTMITTQDDGAYTICYSDNPLRLINKADDYGNILPSNKIFKATANIVMDVKLSTNADGSDAKTEKNVTTLADSLVDESIKYVEIQTVKKCSIVAESTEGGTVSGGTTIRSDESVTLTATANEGYEFIGWFDGETKVCDTKEFLVENVTEDRTYTAKFDFIEVSEPDEPEIPDEPTEPSDFDFESIRTGNGENITVDHENKKISVEVTDSDSLVLYVHQKDIIPGGQIRLKSYNGNKVTYNSTGIYNIYSLYNKYITVYVNVTVDGVTEEYELTTKFGIRETETPFTSIRTQNGSVTEIDHENKKIYVRVDNGDDNLVLYVHQKDAIPGGQIRMKSYNGNKVTYDASGVYRIYTLGSDPIIVSAKVIIGNETLIYDIVADFNADKPDFNFDEIKCDNAEGMTIDHETKTIRIYAKDRANYVTLYRKQYDQIKGTVVLTSFMGNRVQSDLTEGTYKVCFVKNKEVSVKGKLTINDITEEYTIITVFYPEWKFDTLKIDSASSVEIDHESQKITVNASSDSIVLYIDQTATQGNAQVWMKDYNGNKVQYSADDRSYTITKGNEDSLTVSVKVTIFGETRYYDMTVNF